MARPRVVLTPQRTPTGSPPATRLIRIDGYRVTEPALPDYRLPDLFAADVPTWTWPYPCHRLGHVWLDGSNDCAECGASYRAHGPDHGEWEKSPWRAQEVVTAVGGS